jgi:uncharacterized membrane protein
MNASRKRFAGEVRTTFLRGAAVIIPLALTVWFFQALLNAIDGILSPFLEKWIGREIPGLGFVSMVVIILLVGLLSRNLLGRIFFGWFDRLIASIPFVRSVHGAIRDLIGAFAIGGKGKTFRQVVMVQYPRVGLFCIGFVTNETSFVGADNKLVEFVNVYFPHPPNPTSGVLILVPKQEAVPLNLTIEQGLKLVLSGGIVTPDRLTQRQITR